MSLEDKYTLASELLAHPRLAEFISAGFITEFHIRNCRIIVEYCLQKKHCSHTDLVETLSAKYFLSQDRILAILYK